ncbi:hypothetical protein K2X33_03730 [bacterium]|nr:hypothetical protein [bacterium]
MKKKSSRAGKKECYHCKKWLTAKELKTHACWETTEEALTQDLPPALLDAWEKLREAATDFGDQRIYASFRSIMFSRKSCYFFVRPKKSRLELCFFAGRKIKHPSIRKIHPTTKTKYAHMVFVVDSDQVEAPLTDWLQEAYDFCQPMPESKTKTTKAHPLTKRKTITFEELTRK